jgi:hypothetical protein
VDYVPKIRFVSVNKPILQNSGSRKNAKKCSIFTVKSLSGATISVSELRCQGNVKKPDYLSEQ